MRSQGENAQRGVTAFPSLRKVRRNRASRSALGGTDLPPSGVTPATMSEVDSPPSVNAHPRGSGRNAHRTDPPTAANHRIGLSPAAAHRLRTFVQLNRPSIRTPTVDALVTSMYVPSGGLEAAHLAETIAAVALNAAFGAISTIHVLFEAAHNKGNKGCALVHSLGRLSHLLAGSELRCIDVARQPTYYGLLEYCSRVLAGRVVLLANPDIVFDPTDLRAPQRGHSAAARRAGMATRRCRSQSVAQG